MDAGRAVGVGFRSEHYAAIVDSRPAIGWLEVHAENYMVDGGPRLAQLDRIRANYPLSLHAVGLSPGSAAPVDSARLKRLQNLVGRYEPILVSDHLSWSGINGIALPDLFPLPYTPEALDAAAANIGRIQDALARAILVENPSLYLVPAASEMDEADFLCALVARTGCGVLLDINNIHVTAANLGGETLAYIDALPADAIGEIHLAGHKEERDGAATVLIDDHGSPVAESVWRLYAYAVSRLGPRPTLIEWDADIPPLGRLLDEAAKAADLLRWRAAPHRPQSRHHAA